MGAPGNPGASGNSGSARVTRWSSWKLGQAQASFGKFDVAVTAGDLGELWGTLEL